MKTLASYWDRQWILKMVTWAATVIIPFGAAAQTVDWSGLGDGTDWHDGDNWNPAGVPGAGAVVTVAAGATILLTDETAELASFTMTGGSLTFSKWMTRLRAVEVNLQDGIVTLPQAFINNGVSNRVWIVCSNLTVGTNAIIDANAKGYAKQNGEGSKAQYHGGSHGGYSSPGRSGWDRPLPYGSVSNPVAPGSGGGHSASGDGGGAIRIEADGQVTIHGTLNADGSRGTTTHGAGGSGGSIFISCRTFSGSGTGLLSVQAGDAWSLNGGAGAGGRIAVVYDPVAQASMTPVNPGVRFNAAALVSRGSHPFIAEAGTIYLPDTAFLSETMTAQWEGGNLHIPGFNQWSLDNLAVAGKFGLPGVTNIAVANDVAILEGGSLSLYAAQTNAALSPYGMVMTIGGTLSVSNNAKLVLTSHPSNGAIPWIACNRLYVEYGGTIDADYKGYGPPGASDYSGPGAGLGGTYGGGASHGGWGSQGRNEWTARKAPYGDFGRPLTPGSAGGHASKGGFGGGAIAISCTTTAEIHGTLTANGMGSADIHGGVGAGGSILIECRAFLGSSSGLLSAQSGAVLSDGGAGSGGRIAVLYDPAEQASLPQPNPGVAFNAAPGTAGWYPYLAEAGTLFLPQADTLFLSSNMSDQWQDVRLIIPDFTNWLVNGLQVEGQFAIDGLQTIRVSGDMTVNTGAVLSLTAHPTNVVDPEFGFLLKVDGALQVLDSAEVVLTCDYDTGAMPYIEAGSFYLQSGGKITADYRGFDTGKGPGKGIDRAGGGYGGAGSSGRDDTENAGPTNGVAHAPILPGSGAGLYDNDGGGRGGGSIRIGAQGAMEIDGTLSANGMYRMAVHSGGGSGGGILLTAKSFRGTGLLRANGGNSSNLGGAGGGGRIAVWTPFMPPAFLRQFAKRDLPGHSEILDQEILWPDLSLSVAAGIGGDKPEEAGNGTVFFGKINYGTIMIIR